MSHFYATIQGNRGMATRQGSKASGIDGHIRGWHTGARVIVEHIDGRDRVKIYRTGGSSNSSGDLIAEWDQDSKAPSFYK